ncbi:MAG: endonuclease V [Halobacteriales archaeon]
MEPDRPEFVPDGTMERERMERLQTEIADAALFSDDPPLDPASAGTLRIAGIDQAFLDDQAVSAVVVRQAGETVETAHSVTDLQFPYVPGYLAFREGGPILSALEQLADPPDLLLFDGSGRIHYRQAGLATHVGVTFDRPAIGVAKRLLCGTPTGSLTGLEEGTEVAIAADEEVTAENGTVIGYAVQTRQFDSADRHVNPVYVSPGHRTSAERAADLVRSCCAGYKLPEPVRRADTRASEIKVSLADTADPSDPGREGGEDS